MGIEQVVVEKFRDLSPDEQQQVLDFVESLAVGINGHPDPCEERRDEICANFNSAQVERQKGELKFSSNIKELKQLIEE